MPLIPWTTALSVNIASIDAQHQKLIDLMNSLHDVVKSGMPKENIGPVLTELIQAAAEHFAYEEKLMLENGYPKYAEHKKEHELLSAKIKERVQPQPSGKAVSLDAATLQAKEWLLMHIRTVDKAYSTFFVGKGVK